jgi:hypothetical protein
MKWRLSLGEALYGLVGVGVSALVVLFVTYAVYSFWT